MYKSFYTYAEEDVHAHLSPLEVLTLETSFNALKDKFVMTMREKADLLDRIQEDEVIISKLSSKVETSGLIPGHVTDACDLSCDLPLSR